MPRDVCPNCGADLPKKARACPECGSDEKTGWSEDADRGGLGLPEEDDFNYNEFVQREFGKGEDLKPRGLHWFWWVIGILLLGGILYMTFGHFLWIALPTFYFGFCSTRIK